MIDFLSWLNTHISWLSDNLIWVIGLSLIVIVAGIDALVWRWPELFHYQPKRLRNFFMKFVSELGKVRVFVTRPYRRLLGKGNSEKNLSVNKGATRNAKAVTKKRCRCLNKSDGKQCKNSALEGSDYCHRHQNCPQDISEIQRQKLHIQRLKNQVPEEIDAEALGQDGLMPEASQPATVSAQNEHDVKTAHFNNNEQDISKQEDKRSNEQQDNDDVSSLEGLPRQRICPACEKEVSPDDITCNYCGTYLGG